MWRPLTRIIASFYTHIYASLDYFHFSFSLHFTRGYVTLCILVVRSCLTFRWETTGMENKKRRKGERKRRVRGIGGEEQKSLREWSRKAQVNDGRSGNRQPVNWNKFGRTWERRRERGATALAGCRGVATLLSNSLARGRGTGPLGDLTATYCFVKSIQGVTLVYLYGTSR